MTYTVSLVHFLSAGELEQLTAKHMPSLLALNDRYTPNLDPSANFPVTPIYVDALRASWMLDEAPDRPMEEVLVSGVGFAFGVLLSACTALRWAIATDSSAEAFVTMARSGYGSELVSVPPFDYVQKRQGVANVEVVQDFFKHVPSDDIGLRRPSSWR